jgi:rRNA maturation protein Rpf1
MNSLLNELAQTIPNAKVIRRGKSSLNDFALKLRDEGIDHVLLLHRWHGSPGRISFLKTEPTGITDIPPALTLSNVKLRREYGSEGARVIQGISHDAVKEGAQQLVQALSTVLAVPVVDSTTPAATLHLAKAEGSLIRLAVTVTPKRRELGPSMNITRLDWKDYD